MKIPFNIHLFKEKLETISKEYELSVNLNDVLNEDDIAFLLSSEKLNFGYIVDKYCDDGVYIDDIQKVDFNKIMKDADEDYIKLQSSKKDLIKLFNEFSKVL